MNITVELNDEVADVFFRERLKEDYYMLCNEISRLKSKEKLQPFEQEDHDNCFDTVLALESLFNYYFVEEEAKRLKVDGLAIRNYS